MSELDRARLPWLLRHHEPRRVIALFALINGTVSIAIMSAIAMVTQEPFIFPSLGPTAFLFFHDPLSPASSPRNTVMGHAIGVAVGWLALVVCGLTAAGPALAHGVDAERVAACALSLGITAGAMAVVRAPHPPAGATTLIVAMGMLTTPRQLGILMGAVVLITLQALVINRAAGLDYPAWGSSGR